MRSAFLVALALLAGCSRPPTGLGAEVPGTSWTLERVVYADGRVERGSGERVSFNPDGTLLVASCNTCNGSYRFRGARLSTRGPLACTRRACMPGEVELETYFDGEHAVRRDGSYLIVEAGADGTTQLLFLPVSGPPAGP